MQRYREAIDQNTIDTLKRQIEAAKGDPQALKDLLVAELGMQQEADWSWAKKFASSTEEAIDLAISYLKDAADSYNSTAEVEFVKSWGVSGVEAFPTHWHDFVCHFLEAMQSINGYGTGRRAALEAQDTLKNDVSHEFMFWSEKNLFRVFIHYLAALPPDVSTVEERDHMLYAVFPLLPDCIRSRALLDKFKDQSVDIINLRDPKINKLFHSEAFETQEIYEDWKSFHKKMKKRANLSLRDRQAARNELELLTYKEWRRQHCIVSQETSEESKAESKALFKNYCALLEKLNEARKVIPSQPVSQSKPESSGLAYKLGGAGTGLFTGGIIVLGLILGGALSMLATPLIVVLAIVIIAAAVAMGTGFGSGIKVLVDNNSQSDAQDSVVEKKDVSPVPAAVLAQAPVMASVQESSTVSAVIEPTKDTLAPTPSPAFGMSAIKRSTSTIICAIGLGAFTYGMAAPASAETEDLQNNGKPPINQPVDDNDSDDTETPSEGSEFKPG